MLQIADGSAADRVTLGCQTHRVIQVHERKWQAIRFAAKLAS